MSCFKCSKYILFAFNLLIWLAGGAILGIGIFLRVSKPNESILKIIPSELLTVSADLLIAAGVIMFVLAFFGCCGAAKENQCLLSMYFTLLIIVFGLQLGLFIWSMVNNKSLEENVTAGFSQLEDISNNKDFTDVIQPLFKCCGKGPFTCNGFSSGIPVGCECVDSDLCKTVGELDTCTAGDGITADTRIFSRACPSAVVDSFKSNLKLTIGVSVGILVFQLFGIAISMFVCCKIRSGESEMLA